MRQLLAILVVIIVHSLSAQQVVDIGVLYHPGDSLYGPRHGVMTKMPQGWVGGVPEGSALFIMESLKLNDAQIYVRANADDIESIATRWDEGLNLSRALDIQPVGEINRQPQRISREFVNAANKNSKCFAIAKCGEYGNCVSFFLISWKGSFEEARREVIQFAAKTELVQPFMKDLHSGFVWKDFLSNKYIYSYLYDRSQEKSTNLWLCEDGTFRMEVKRKGAAFVKNNKQYYGKTFGTWYTDGVGQAAKVTLTFDKKGLQPYTFDVSIDRNKIFVNGERFFAVNNQDCN